MPVLIFNFFKISFIKRVLSLRPMNNKPSLTTVLSPRLLDLCDISNSIVVIIDVFRATSTIATALYNGATKVIPVDNVEQCITIGKKLNAITASSAMEK